MKKFLPIFIALIFVAALITITLMISKKNPKVEPNLYEGTIECEELDVASKIPGKLLNVLVDEGDFVKKGDLLAVVETKEIDAKLDEVENKEYAAGAMETKANMGATLERKLLTDELDVAREKLKVAQENYKTALNATRPEIIREAQANYDAKKSMLEMAKSGARDEVKEMARINLDIAQKALDTAKAAYDRIEKLYDDGVVPKQKEEEVKLAYDGALAKRDAAKQELQMAKAGPRPEEIYQLTQGLKAAEATLEMAKNGARSEDKAEALAMVNQAKIGVKAAETAIAKADVTLQDAEAANYTKQAAAAGVKQVKIAQDDGKIYSPISGYVVTRMSNKGELVAAGFPIFTITEDKNYKIKVYVPENKAKASNIGKKVKVYIPVLGENAFNGVISKVAMAADFATKVATNQQGTFDLRYVEVTVKLEDFNLKLKNGITARVEIPEKE